MKKKFRQAFFHPVKAGRYIRLALKKRIMPRKDLLIMVGLDPKGELDILHPGYKNCLVFEAHPFRYKKLSEKFASKENIELYNYAVSTYDGEIEFNISSNNSGASSSIGNFDETWLKNQSQLDIKMTETIKVPCINLYDFLKEKNIDYIDDYISDIQGMDLQVLKTLKPMIEEKKIGTIKCEVTKNKYRNIYKDLPDNSEKGFDELLNDKYEKVAKGRGLLTDNQFDSIPDHMWEMDVKWRKK